MVVGRLWLSLALSLVLLIIFSIIFLEVQGKTMVPLGHHMEVVPFLFISKYDLDSLLK